MDDYFLRSRARTRARISSPTDTPPPSLPTDVLIEILKRLPLKSLVRFTCICKSWFSLLTSPSFISIHSTFNSQNFLLFKESINIHFKSFHTNFTVLNPNTLFKQAEFGFPVAEFGCPVGKNHFVVCSSDGVVCLFDFYNPNPDTAPIVLWNPSIRKAIVVSAPVGGGLELTSGGFPKVIFGFGFDLCSDSYKAVRVAYFRGGRGGSNGTTFRVDVYCVGDGEWRSLGVTYVAHNIVTIRWRGVCLNGVIHWICSVDSDVTYRVDRLILTLNLGNGELGEIMLPKELVDMPNQTLRVVTVPRNGKDVLGVIHNVTNVFSLWGMEKYGVKESWIKLFGINLKCMIKDMNVLILSDHFVVAQTVLRTWVSYDHKLNKIMYLKSLPTIPPEGLDYVDTYVESLILVGERKGVIHDKELEEVQKKKPKRSKPNPWKPHPRFSTWTPHQSSSA